MKDKLSASVYGIGYIGKGNHIASLKGKQTKAYKTWQHMIGRCYDAKTQEKKPAYIGCTVCKEWHNFNTFADWFDANYIDGYHLDKDIKIEGNRIYSPEACSFVSLTENNIKAKAKHYKFINPEGEVVEIYNLASFCRENNLQQNNMGQVHLGRSPYHKGWRSCRKGD